MNKRQYKKLKKRKFCKHYSTFKYINKIFTLNNNAFFDVLNKSILGDKT